MMRSGTSLRRPDELMRPDEPRGEVHLASRTACLSALPADLRAISEAAISDFTCPSGAAVFAMPPHQRCMI